MPNPPITKQQAAKLQKMIEEMRQAMREARDRLADVKLLLDRNGFVIDASRRLLRHHRRGK